MDEVRDAAGFNGSRSADFLIMGLWPSRGLNMVGIERKSYRGDWLKELKTPEKAENIYQYCDYWYLLTDNEGVAKIEEIPETWGWMHIDPNGKLKIHKEPSKLTPLPISRTFLACILKRAACRDGWVTENSIADKINEAKERGMNERNSRNQRIIEDYNTLVKDVQDFEEITGIKLLQPKWGTTGKKTGEAVKFVLDGGVDEMKKQIVHIKNLNASITKKIADFESVIVKPELFV